MAQYIVRSYKEGVTVSFTIEANNIKKAIEKAKVEVIDIFGIIDNYVDMSVSEIVVAI
jgi:hypothetical protein